MNRIKEMRQARGWLQRDLERQLNLGHGNISKYEKEERSLTPDLICRLCDLFGCTSDYLLCRSASSAVTVSDEDAALLSAYHAADDRARAVVDLTLEPYKIDGQPEMIQLAARGKRIEKLNGTPDRDEIREALSQVKSESEPE